MVHTQAIPTLRSPVGPAGRLAAATPVAALITAALILAMGAAIEVEDVDLAAPPQRTLPIITPQIVDAPPILTILKPSKPDIAAPPAIAPVRTLGSTDIDLPPVALDAPSPSVRAARLALPVPPRSGVMDRPTEAIRPPSATYPMAAITSETEGRCDVRFSVDPAGAPYNVSAACSDPVFVRAAEKAVRRAQFLPRVDGGRAVAQENVVYPIVFELSD